MSNVIPLSNHPRYNQARKPHFWSENGVLMQRRHNRVTKLSLSRAEIIKEELSLRVGNSVVKEDSHQLADTLARMHDLNLALGSLTKVAEQKEG